MQAVRPELPPMPPRFERLPVDARGFPVPWFVAWLREDGQTPAPRGEGTPDFRIIYPGAIADAHQRRCCWLCGQPLGRYVAFNMGPMCTVNRTNGEPPSHRSCAEYAAKACPFLTRPHARRRPVEGGLPLPGIPLKRNPGVAAVWICRGYGIHAVGDGVLFKPDEPTDVLWYCEGRPATRTEVDAAINAGLPALRRVAAVEGAEEKLREAATASESLRPKAAAR